MHALILLGVWPEYLTCLIAYRFDGERQRLASKEARQVSADDRLEKLIFWAHAGGPIRANMALISGIMMR